MMLVFVDWVLCFRFEMTLTARVLLRFVSRLVGYELTTGRGIPRANGSPAPEDFITRICCFPDLSALASV
jgi:hypothetical protein